MKMLIVIVLLMVSCHAASQPRHTPQDCAFARDMAYDVMKMRQGGVSIPAMRGIIANQPKNNQPLLLFLTMKAWKWDAYEDMDAQRAAAHSFSVQQYKQCIDELVV